MLTVILYAECRYAECRGAKESIHSLLIFNLGKVKAQH